MRTPTSLPITHRPLKWSFGVILQSLQDSGSERFTLSGVQHFSAFLPAMFILHRKDLQPFSEVFKLLWNRSLIWLSVNSWPSSSFDSFVNALMHQDSKSSRQLSISSVGTQHLLILLLSLSEKLLGSSGTSNDSDGCHTNGPSSLDIWICLEALEVTVSGPSLRLQMQGKVAMLVLLCLLVCSLNTVYV